MPTIILSFSASGATVTARHFLPGRQQSGLEDVLWLVANFAAGRTLDVMQRAPELLRKSRNLTPWEVLLTRDLLADSVDRFNAEVATSLDKVERDFVDVVNAYRRILGLSPFEIEERCVVAARKHSQEMVDLGYFGHISPVPRNRAPKGSQTFSARNSLIGSPLTRRTTSPARKPILTVL